MEKTITGLLLSRTDRVKLKQSISLGSAFHKDPSYQTNDTLFSVSADKKTTNKKP